MSEHTALSFLVMGAFFGLTAGISPGPMLTLVITETLKYNRRAGFKIAVSPLLTDLPIIIVTYFIFSQLSHFQIVLSLISFAGGIYFAYLAYETVRVKEMNFKAGKYNNNSLKRGVSANFLNPNPYIFWFTVGIPTAFKAHESGLMTVILYFLLFYVMLSGSKMVIAILVDRSKAVIRNNSYRAVMIILGSVLFFFAGYFFYGGIKMLISNP